MQASRDGRRLRLAHFVVLCVALALAGVSAAAQERYGAARSVVARTQEDLRRAAGLVKSDKERERYENAQKSLSQFDRGLSKRKFDKDKLDDAINDLKNLVEHNTLQGPDRDALQQDLDQIVVACRANC